MTDAEREERIQLMIDVQCRQDGVDPRLTYGEAGIVTDPANPQYAKLVRDQRWYRDQAEKFVRFMEIWFGDFGRVGAVKGT